MDLNMANGVDYFLEALPVIGTGYLGIFIVTGIIVLTITALNFFTRPPKQKG